jgi:serine-type D-Ala-D-Ala carboxypeptidase/endopeptidase (penicillin-binding protein 4)
MKKRSPYVLITLLLVVMAIVSAAFYISPEKNHSLTHIHKALDDFASHPSLHNASWGFYAINTASGDPMASHNPHLALIPASTQKVITTLTALALLGENYRFETLLQHTGTINNGVLNGDLIITGKGDPTLGSETIDDSLSLTKLYAEWTQVILQSGIRKISGSIIADGSWFDDFMVPAKWMWEDIGNYYGAGAHALTVNENLYSVFFRPGQREGEQTGVIRTSPDIPGMGLKNDVTTGPRRSGDNVYIYGAPYGNERWLTGTVPLGENNFEVKGSIPDPGQFLAASFKNYFLHNQIAINGDVYTHRNTPVSITTKPRTTLTIRKSPPLSVITARTNFNSVNTYAENLLKTLGKTFGDEGSYKAGSQVVVDFWKNQGLELQGMRMHDGSGLSPINNITPQQLTQMLYFAAQDTILWSALTKGFPLAHRTGSLAAMFGNTPSAGILMAKSGFLGNVRSYAGYTRCRNGNLIAFTLIVNNYDGTPAEMRRRMETLMDALTRSRL